jgi:hypothetical protein
MVAIIGIHIASTKWGSMPITVISGCTALLQALFVYRIRVVFISGVVIFLAAYWYGIRHENGFEDAILGVSYLWWSRTLTLIALAIERLLWPEDVKNHQPEIYRPKRHVGRRNNHDHQKIRYYSRDAAEIVKKRMQDQKCYSWESLNVYYNDDLDAWFIGKSSRY